MHPCISARVYANGAEMPLDVQHLAVYVTPSPSPLHSLALCVNAICRLQLIQLLLCSRHLQHLQHRLLAMSSTQGHLALMMPP
mmetsp:Transcript_15979/g.34517  ORF Transcript_15979/g.34517 Transcript_15979/m.34517 type:complete len:83 (+) Transcript_15979:459-707(+)